MQNESCVSGIDVNWLSVLQQVSVSTYAQAARLGIPIWLCQETAN